VFARPTLEAERELCRTAYRVEEPRKSTAAYPATTRGLPPPLLPRSDNDDFLRCCRGEVAVVVATAVPA
jgi:hypothetical protein